MLTDGYLKELRMTENQVKKEASEEEIKDPNEGCIGCIGWLMAPLGLLILLYTIFLNMLSSYFFHPHRY